MAQRTSGTTIVAMHSAMLTCTRAWIAAALLAVTMAVPSSAAAAVDAQQTQALHALFAEDWEAQARQSPEFATFRGDHRYGDRLSDPSDAGVAARDTHTRQMLTQAQAIRRDALSPVDRTSLDLFIDNQQRALRLQAFDGWRRMTVRSIFGSQSFFAALLRQSPARNAADAEAILARMAAYPRQMAQLVARLRGGIAQGYVPARPVLERALAQIDAQLAPAARRGPFFEPFMRLGSEVTAAEREALQARAQGAIEQHVLPALRVLRAFIVAEYLPVAPAEVGLARYPRGAELYAELVRQQTTTELTPREVHAIGLREMARLRGEMQAVMREVKFDGSFTQFVAHLNSDPKFFYDSPEALLDGYRALAKRIDPEMPRLFATLPRTPYGIRAMPAHMGEGAADTYNGPPEDLSQAGWFNANTLGYRRKPRWAMATLIAHEAVPGHHMQNARAAELGALPPFRRDASYTAYGEGWALYAETLGREIGLYDDPYSLFGHLQAQALRAARLVVDTGLHSMGWTRQQAIDYMLAEVGESPVFVGTEVDRYLSIPGQALAYMVGQLKIVELRQRASAALGARFDLRAFHNVLLDSGPLPLVVLERVVDEWIAAQSAATGTK